MCRYEESRSTGPLPRFTGLCAAAAAVLCLAGARMAPAADDAVTGVVATIKKAHRGDDDGSLPTALSRAVELHNASADSADRAKIQGALGALVKAKDAGSGRSKAAEALGQLNDPAGAYKALKASLPRGKGPEVSPYELRVIEAVGRLVPKEAVPDLVKLIKKSKATQVVQAVLRALACYGKVTLVREKVLAETLDAGLAWKAAADKAEKKLAKRKPPKDPKKAPKPKKGDLKLKAAISAWVAYGPVLVESLNKLTGKTYATADEWLAIRKDKKAKLADLFGGA